MPKLVANAPRKRLEWVLKTYWPKYTVPVTDTFVVALHLLGRETYEDASEAAEEASVYATGAVIERKDRADKILKMLVPVLGSLAHVRNENDFLIPWIAKQLVDLWRAAGGDEELRAHSGGGTGGFVDIAGLGDDEDDEIDEETIAGLAELAAPSLADYSRALETLKAKGTAIAMWARETKRDLGRVTLAQALEAVADYEFKTSLVPQGTVVYTFPDGYTVQELRTAPELKAEGEVMQHCVGSYCEQVNSGESRIYSLRDAHGNPHVTMEWQRDDSDLDDFPAGQPMPSRGHFVQIYGKQNEPPAEKYKPYVQQFIREKFDADPRSMLLAGAKARELDLRGADLSNAWLAAVDFTGADLTNATLYEAKLGQARFHNATLHGANFEHADMRHADLSSADATMASFRRTELSGVTWEKTKVAGADFRDADWGEALYRGYRNDMTRFVRFLAAGGGMLGTETATFVDEPWVPDTNVIGREE